MTSDEVKQLKQQMMDMQVNFCTHRFQELETKINTMSNQVNDIHKITCGVYGLNTRTRVLEIAVLFLLGAHGVTTLGIW